MSDVVTQNVEWGKIMNYEYDGAIITRTTSARDVVRVALAAEK